MKTNKLIKHQRVITDSSKELNLIMDLDNNNYSLFARIHKRIFVFAFSGNFFFCFKKIFGIKLTYFFEYKK